MDKRLEQTFVQSRYSNANKHRKLGSASWLWTKLCSSKIHMWLYWETGLSGDN